jgi:crotonobetainyl-CoA:carnitine CoA-transferase CaiB-like acyl-CoA transferase
MLSAFLIVETGDDAATRYCGRLFAMLGATVLRVGDAPGGALDCWLDQNKCIISSLDQALDTLARAPPATSAFLTGQTPAHIDSAKMSLTERGSDALLIGATWYGREGPYRDWIGDDALIYAMCGIAAAFGTPDGPPTLPQGFAMQITAGATLFVGALAALWHRRCGGFTAQVELSVLEAALCFSETAPPKFEQTPDAPRGKDVNRYASNHPMTVYRASDGWIGVTALTPAQWRGLADLVGQDAWIDDASLATSQGRVAQAARIDAVLSAVFAAKPASYWVEEGQRLRVPVAPVPTPRDVVDTPHWMERGSFGPLPGAPGIVGPGLPFIVRHSGPGLSEPVLAGVLPLSGMRVADFSMGWAGPLATRLLGDLGADVVKIESPTHQDWWRGWEPPGASDPPLTELSPLFNAMNRNKRDIALDLTDSADLAEARRIVEASDVVIENFAPGVMAKLGLAPEDMMRWRAGLSIVSMGAFGAAGPWSGFRAYGATVEQASGMPHVNGHPDWPPSLQHFALGDPVAGIFAAAAALIGLHARAGAGSSWFDLGQVECLFQLGADALLQAQSEGNPARLGSRSSKAAPRCVAEAGDGQFVAIVCTVPDQWRALARWLGRADWLSDGRLDLVSQRNEAADQIEMAISAKARAYTAVTLSAELQASGVPAAPVLAGHQLIDDAHQRVSGTWTWIERRYVGLHVTAAPVIHIDGTRLPIARPAPLLGEHGNEIRDQFRFAAVG